MIEERVKLGYKTDSLNAYTYHDILEHLNGIPFNPEEFYYEFQTKGVISANDIKKFLILPYEITIAGSSENLILRTGTKDGGANEEDFQNHQYNSTICFHTHNEVKGEEPVDSPSFGDLWIANFWECKATLALANPKGIIIYQKTKSDVYEYCEKKGIAIYKNFDDNLKSIYDLTQAEQTKLQREFAEDSNAIVEEALWENHKDIEHIIEKIFYPTQSFINK